MIEGTPFHPAWIKKRGKANPLIQVSNQEISLCSCSREKKENNYRTVSMTVVVRLRLPLVPVMVRV
jgi:hypothetical protein